MESWKDIRSLNMEELTDAVTAAGEKSSGQNRSMAGSIRNSFVPAMR